MKQKLTTEETEALLPHIKTAMETGKKWEDKSLHHPAGAIIDAVLSIPGVKKDESDEDSSEGFSTNGWQYDWWQQVTYKGKRFTLEGSGYYGGHKFYTSDE
jgi:hypothetical protein